MNIYIGHLGYDVTGEELEQVFAPFGRVESVKVIRDKYTGESKGFAFVDMPVKEEAEKALLAIAEVKGRSVVINEARPQEKRPSFNSQSQHGRRNKTTTRRAKRY